MATLTDNSKNAIKLLLELQKNNVYSVCSKELITTYKELTTQFNFKTNLVNYVNATLASLASKEYIKKEVKSYNDKMYTFYSLLDNFDYDDLLSQKE